MSLLLLATYFINVAGTTLCVKNIDCRETPTTMVSRLEDTGFYRGADFDFLYLPRSISKGERSRAYCFVNFRCNHTAQNALEKLQGRMLRKTQKLVLDVTMANNHGLRMNVLGRKYIHRVEKKSYSPIIFDSSGTEISLYRLSTKEKDEILTRIENEQNIYDSFRLTNQFQQTSIHDPEPKNTRFDEEFVYLSSNDNSAPTFQESESRSKHIDRMREQWSHDPVIQTPQETLRIIFGESIECVKTNQGMLTVREKQDVKDYRQSTLTASLGDLLDLKH